MENKKRNIIFQALSQLQCMSENVLVAKIISVKQYEMLPEDGMNMDYMVEIQSQQSIFIDFLNTDLT